MFFKQTFTLTLVVGLLGFGLFPIQAQDEADDTGPNFTSRELEALSKLPKIPQRQQRQPGELAFAVFSYGRSGEDYFYLRNEKPERVFFNTGVVRRFQYGGERSGLIIYKRLENEEGEYALMPVGKAVPPDGSRDGIILFQPSENDSEMASENLTFIDLSRRSFGPNDIRMVNMTSAPLMLQLNDKPIKLPPFREVIRTHRQEASLFSIKVSAKGAKRVKTVYSNVFQSEPKKRVLFMIVPDWSKTSAGSPVRCLIYKDTGEVSG